jgi:hypothetical protein
MILGDGTEVQTGNTYGQGEVGDKRGSKEMDRCPLTASWQCLLSAYRIWGSRKGNSGLEQYTYMLQMVAYAWY